MSMPASKAATLALLLGFTASPSHAQIVLEGNHPVKFDLSLFWRGTSNEPAGVRPEIIITPDHITVAPNQAAEAKNTEQECAKRIAPGADANTTAAAIMQCLRLGARENMSATREAVILPIIAGPTKCTDSNFSNGIYRVCAGLLRVAPNQFQFEYETDEKHDGQMRAVRTRFELDVLGYFKGCAVKIVAAFSFNPREPGKLTPFDQGKPVSETCYGPSPMD